MWQAIWRVGGRAPERFLAVVAIRPSVPFQSTTKPRSEVKRKPKTTPCSNTWTEAWRATCSPPASARTTILMSLIARHPPPRTKILVSRVVSQSASLSSWIFKRTSRPSQRSRPRQCWAALTTANDLRVIQRAPSSTILEAKKCRAAKPITWWWEVRMLPTKWWMPPLKIWYLHDMYSQTITEARIRWWIMYRRNRTKYPPMATTLSRRIGSRLLAGKRHRRLSWVLARQLKTTITQLAAP